MNTAKRVLLTIAFLVYLAVGAVNFWYLYHDGTDSMIARVFGLGVATALALAGKIFVDAFRGVKR